MKIIDNRKPKQEEPFTIGKGDWFYLKNSKEEEYLCTLAQVERGVYQVICVDEGGLNRMFDGKISLEATNSKHDKFSPEAIRIITEDGLFTLEKVKTELHIVS